MNPERTSSSPTGGEQPKDPNNTISDAGVSAPKTDGATPPAPPAPGVTPPSWSTASGSEPSMPASSMNVPKPRKKGLIVGLIIGLVVLIVGTGAAAAYFGVVVPNKPENVLKAALANSFSLEKAKSEHVDGDFSITEKTGGQTFAGDFTGSGNSDGVFAMKANIDAIVTKVTVDMRSTDGKSFYIRVGGLDGLPELMEASGDTSAAMYAPMVAGLNEQWVEINQSILRQMGVGTIGLGVSQADMDKLAQAYANHEFITFKEKLADEKVANKDSYHYKVVIDKQQLKDFMRAVKDAKVESIKLTDDGLRSFNSVIKDVDFTKYPVDLWVSKEDKMIRQIKFAYNDDTISASIRYTVTDYNKPVNVTKPTGAKSLLEVVSDMFGGASGDSLLLDELQGSGISL